jgi:uncharacterized protein (DUF1800 family)
MALPFDRQYEHLLRRAGFGARQDELDTFRQQSIRGAVSRLVDYVDIPDDVDSHIQQNGYVQMTLRGTFRTLITDARQRWLFRMVHTNRPLQEKMTLFWHNHFATAYTKLQGQLTAPEATRYMAAKASEDPGGVRGQIEMLRDNALGNFRDLLVAVAQDTAMLYWLDGYTNTRARPQENFGREIMELFTMGVGHYTEPDVYAAARVFTGWNVARAGGAANDAASHLQFVYNANQHETTTKTFSFPIYPDGGKTIPARGPADGMQDGLDFIDALARNPETPRYLGKKLYRVFISETGNIDDKWLDRIAAVYMQSHYDMRAVMQEVLLSGEFWDQASYFSRYSWPVEYVVRAIKDIGWRGYTLATAITSLGAMGQNLYDPPDVAGWDLGKSWFSTGSMLARMNFASDLAFNQKFNLANAVASAGAGRSPESLLAYVLEGLPTADLDATVRSELLNYLRATTAWTGSTTQLQAKTSGLVHLVAGSPEYQFV